MILKKNKDMDFLMIGAVALKTLNVSAVINYTVKKIFRITDEFAHNYVIFVTILCPTLTKMDTLIIQNKLHILRNGFQNSQYPFPILVDFKK